MSSIRINQRLKEGYNPDGTPGTVSTGVPGLPGPPPSDEDIAAAVQTYIAANPVTITQVSRSSAENNRFGSGAAGRPGSYVDVGSHGTLHGYVTADGTPTTVNLYLEAKNGTVVSADPMQVQGPLDVQGDLTIYENGQVISLQTELNLTGIPDLSATFQAALT